MKHYSPLVIFPIFVLIVVLLSLIFTINSKNKFQNQALAQVHIMSDEAPPVERIWGEKNKDRLHGPLGTLQFPDAIIISQATDSARLESASDSDTVTTWYKNEVSRLGFEIKSFVNANTNGNIENKFIATKEKSNLYIEIKKPNGFFKTSINIEMN